MRVLPDRIEILSHPGADRSISIEGLKNYRASSRRYRNRRIGEFLKELHLTEGRNTGFQKIIRALKANGSPMPIFETDEDRTYFLTTFLIHPEFIASNKASREAINEAINDGLTDNEKLVLNAMKLDDAITTPKMVEMLGLPRTAVQRAIKSLKEKGIIQREGAKKNGKWIVLK